EDCVCARAETETRAARIKRGKNFITTKSILPIKCRRCRHIQLTEAALAGENKEGRSPPSGPVAQLGARFHGMEEVVGSIPTRSTNLNPPRIKHFQTVCANRTKIV